ncbi:sodium-dependent transporter [Rubrivirga sp.]|uniref:sodium-dependent transporter n=1 Tax=Rubrivirga sp. TaxID=1885344 RepID=UPI003C7090E8
MPDPASPTPAPDRGVWSSKLGFVLAASGSAIGLGNIVFFASNAYQFGGGAFYVPYFIALFALGIPVMITEFSLGTMTGRSFPMALSSVVGKKGEFVGWWSLGSCLFLTMYYVGILGWALCMMVGAIFGLMEPGATAPFAPFAEPSAGPNATAYFFGILSSWWPLVAIVVIWAITLVALLRGTETIEKVVRVAVPLMWLFMIVLIIRGVTLPGGTDGVMYLFTPDLAGISQPDVWKGAFSQMFFSLSLGLGTMTAYASYLPKDSDQVTNSFMVSFLNCGFEYIAGIAIFSMLFAFSLNPVGGTLSLSFFAIPQGIAAFPFAVKVFGFSFFFLLVMAGITSAISLVEGMASAIIDKLAIDRTKALAMVAIPGIVGSVITTLPFIVDPDLGGNGTMGLSFLDILDHWVFGYSMLAVGFLQCILLGWVFGAANLRAFVNEHSRFTLGAWFDVFIRFIIPAILLTVIVWNLAIDLTGDTLYGGGVPLGFVDWFPVVIPLVWIGGTLGLAAYFTSRETASAPAEPAIATFES